MATSTRLRSIDTHNLRSTSSPPCSSPTKRSSTSPALDPEGHPRVLRTKLSSLNEDHTRLDSNNVERHDPSTPPEFTEEGGSTVQAATNGRMAEKENGRGANEGLSDGATQTATAERQTRELGQLSYQAQNLLSRLCSQHPASEYNNLKRAVAAATSGVYQSVQHVGQSHPPMPPFRHAQSADPFSFPTMARPAAPPRTASAGHLVTPQPIRAAQVTRSTRSNANTPPPPRSTLTPSLARVNLEFSLNAQPTTSSTPVQVEQKSAAEKTVKETILDDLVEGEPVSVERTPTKVVVSETLPTPAVAQESQTTPSIHGLLPGMQIMNGVPVKTSVSHPINISPLVPPELLPYYSSRIFAASSSLESASSPSAAAPTSSFLLDPQPSCDLLTLITPVSNGVCPLPPNASSLSSSTLKIGNFMLSSCPGKKVRMNGESLKGGRGAICRDVKLDLQRAKDEGVRMVVCCLDDSELAFLGTPFSEYAAACESLELQILRIPMVEGFAPSSPSSLDAQLDRLIQNHTLRGDSVLAHCRGGIGRAGLVASCWMIKMGMVASRYGFEEKGEGERGWLDVEPIVIVERVIELIRKRRSVKSIETTHQVKFLLEYIDYLQRNAKIVSGSDLVKTN
ncbi:hypothetical protein JCM16303_001477 [Sporobolomyces ruberrimus]